MKFKLYFTDNSTYSFYADDFFKAEERAQEIAKTFGKTVGYYENI